jgi:capsule biosynthesis phosphatase
MDFNVIIPMGGLGERFSNEKFDSPKPFVKAKGKEIIFWVLESLKKSNIDNIYIPYNKILKEFNFEEELIKNFPDINFKFLCLEEDTKGASDTVYKMLIHMSKEERIKPFFTVDGDTFYKINIKEIIKKNGNGIIYFKDYHKKPIYSYIQFNEEKKLTKIQEKNKISDNANVGIYIFKDGDTFLEFYKELEELNVEKEQYISKIFEMMLNKNIEINTFQIKKDNFICLGTPEQVIEFSYNNNTSDKKRICFDLDNTLVTYPKKKNDYTSCLPIQKNINFLNKLKEEGNYIIIHSARRMKTHNGNLDLVKEDILEITKEQLLKFGIHYDELILGKPYADLYIDDKAINAFKNLEKETGFYFKKTGETRNFNSIKFIENKFVEKKSENLNLKGEIFYYKNIPLEIQKFFPKLVSNTDNSYIIEKIPGITFSDLFVNDLLSEEDLSYLFQIIEEIHNFKFKDESQINIYGNYFKKIEKRKLKFAYHNFEKNFEIFDFLDRELTRYEKEEIGEKTIIHGDLTFTNIISNKQNSEIKFIDMKGEIGNTNSIYGDKYYDFAKIYHSILGYDFIIKGMEINKEIVSKNKKIFEEYITKAYGKHIFKEIEILTLSLFVSLIPLHEEWKHQKFWKLTLNLFSEISNLDT